MGNDVTLLTLGLSTAKNKGTKLGSPSIDAKSTAKLTANMIGKA